MVGATTLVQDKTVRDRLRHYDDPIDSRNLANEIDATSVRARSSLRR